MSYQHLYYFWVAAKEGSITAAARKLRLSQPTVSGQILALESVLGLSLFARRRGGVTLTPDGATAFRYADEIFSLGNTMREVLAGRSAHHSTHITIGITDVVPKSVAAQVLLPLLRAPEQVRLRIVEDRQERLLAELTAFSLDLVLVDDPVDNVASEFEVLKVLDCGVSFMANAAIQLPRGEHFLKRLEGVPFILPIEGRLRAAVTRALSRAQVSPLVVAEVQDSAMMKTLGRLEAAVFPVPSVVEREVMELYSVRCLGRINEPVSFHAIMRGTTRNNPLIEKIVTRAMSLNRGAAARPRGDRANTRSSTRRTR